MKTKKEIGDHLKKFANDYVVSKGYEFGFGSGEDINEMAEKAAGKIIKPEEELKNAPQDQLIGIAEKSFSIFIDHMILARSIPNVMESLPYKEDNIVGEVTEDFAKSRLCPMWPICD